MHSPYNLTCHTLPKINNNPIINPRPFDPTIEYPDHPIFIPIATITIIIRDQLTYDPHCDLMEIRLIPAIEQVDIVFEYTDLFYGDCGVGF